LFLFFRRDCQTAHWKEHKPNCVPAAMQAGKDFLEAKKAEAGVIALPSGLLYKVLNKGDGTSHPSIDTPCSCHYAGTLIDGTPFDSSYSRGQPSTFAPNQVIKGWTEALQLMVKGDKWELYIPYNLAYGEAGRPPKIPAYATLVFTIEIVSIPPTAADGIKFLADNQTKPGVVALPSGLQYRVLKSGSGTMHPLASTQCQCKYRGTLIDGTQFDAGTANFAPNQVIKGWTEAMQLMVEGDEWELTIPSNLAYGDRGAPPEIPGKACLVFTMELQKVL
jgi:FKBP-type peptidyl-prolyl cis-trans isomerase